MYVFSVGLQVLFKGYMHTSGLFINDGNVFFLPCNGRDLKHLHCLYIYVSGENSVKSFPSFIWTVFGKFSAVSKKENHLLLIPVENRKLSLIC